MSKEKTRQLQLIYRTSAVEFDLMNPSHSYTFPQDFLFAAATASFQVEGAANEDGRGASVWDVFAKKPGRVFADHNGDRACNQYHLYPKDIELMQRLGLGAYRFSFSWSRVLPEGEGRINAKGMDYYDRLVDALLAAGIQPWATLFHWDLPQALEDKYGGWRSMETAKRFGDYCGVMSEHFSDRIQHFFTINEFVCFTDMGYHTGLFAPGLKLGIKERNQIRHNALYAHGLGALSLRAKAKQPLIVGVVENPSVAVPIYETEEHITAARTAFRERNAHFLTTVMEGAYPECYLQSAGSDAPVFTAAEMEVIGTPLDFLGLNIYAPMNVRASRDASSAYEVVPTPKGYPRMDTDWLFIGPQISYWAPRFAQELWNPPAIYITENGCACNDVQTLDGEILDTDRILYLRNHFLNASRAISEGYKLKGYFVWSLLDNFEWADGYSKRFGIHYVNYETMERTPKLSADYYRDVIAARRVL